MHSTARGYSEISAGGLLQRIPESGSEVAAECTGQYEKSYTNHHGESPGGRDTVSGCHAEPRTAACGINRSRVLWLGDQKCRREEKASGECRGREWLTAKDLQV
jgi:hypothetical protein